MSDRPLLWADQKEVADASKKAQPHQWLNTRNQYLATFSTPEGRQTLIDLLYWSNFFRRNYTGNNAQTVLEAYRHIIVHYLEYIPGLIGDVFFDYCQTADNALVQDMMLKLDEERLLNG